MAVILTSVPKLSACCLFYVCIIQGISSSASGMSSGEGRISLLGTVEYQ